jgi:hypothetical protein
MSPFGFSETGYYIGPVLAAIFRKLSGGSVLDITAGLVLALERADDGPQFVRVRRPNLDDVSH